MLPVGHPQVTRGDQALHAGRELPQAQVTLDLARGQPQRARHRLQGIPRRGALLHGVRQHPLKGARLVQVVQV